MVVSGLPPSEYDSVLGGALRRPEVLSFECLEDLSERGPVASDPSETFAVLPSRVRAFRLDRDPELLLVMSAYGLSVLGFHPGCKMPAIRRK